MTHMFSEHTISSRDTSPVRSGASTIFMKPSETARNPTPFGMYIVLSVYLSHTDLIVVVRRIFSADPKFDWTVVCDATGAPTTLLHVRTAIVNEPPPEPERHLWFDTYALPAEVALEHPGVGEIAWMIGRKVDEEATALPVPPMHLRAPPPARHGPEAPGYICA